MPDEYWEDVNANRLTVGMPVCAVRAVLARGSVPMGRDDSGISSFTGNHIAIEDVYLMSGATSGLGGGGDGIRRGDDAWSVRSSRFSSTSSRDRMDRLRNYSAVWAQFEKRSRIYPFSTYHRPAYFYSGGDY